MRRSLGIQGFAVLAAVVATLFLAVPTQSMAADEDIYRENSDVSRMFHKFGRGVVNVLTGWIEIPKNVAKQWRETDPFTGFVLGVIKGFGWGFGRTVAGFYEIVTFPFPIPRDYQPIMMPEFILPSIWGESLPIFRDDFASEGGTSESRYTYAAGSTYGKQAAINAANRSTPSP